MISGFEEDTGDVGDGDCVVDEDEVEAIVEGPIETAPVVEDVEVLEVVEVDEGVVTFEPPVESVGGTRSR